MSSCCWFLVLAIVFIGIIIACVLYNLADKIYKLFGKKNTPEDDVPTAAAPIIPTSVIRQANVKAKEEDNNEHEDEHEEEEEEDSSCPDVSFDVDKESELPRIRMCRDAACEYSEICGVKLCRHLRDKARIDSERQTTNAVVYIHLTGAIIVFVITPPPPHRQKFDNSEEIFEDDINYINSYTSKFMDLSVFSIRYERMSHIFYDHTNTPLSTIANVNNNTNLLRKHSFQPSPSAPSLIHGLQLQPPGNFIYIPKQ